MQLDLSKFAETMTDVYSIWGKEITPGAITIMYRVLSKKLTQEQFDKAVETHVELGAFLPTPKDLIEAVQVSPEDIAAAQLDLYAQKRFNEVDAIAKDALRQMGGYSAFLMSQNPAKFRRDFAKLYVGLAKQRDRQDIPKQKSLSEDLNAQKRRIDNILQRQRVGISVSDDELKFLAQHKHLWEAC